MKTFYISVICLLLAFPLAAQNKYYVKSNGYGKGSSWVLAMKDLQAAVDAASPGDSVFVAIGVYKGGFFMKEGVIVQGGYTANTSNPSERIDVVSNAATDILQQSVLDGEGQQRVLTQYAAFTQPTTWDGFVIQNGKPSGQLTVGSIIFSEEDPSSIVGVIYKYDEVSKIGMMIGTEEVRKQWGGYLSEVPELAVSKNKEEAKADLQGLNNVDEILSLLGNSSIDFSMENNTLTGNYAAFWCDTLTTGGYEDWYLPSAGEMQEVYASNVNKVLKGIGKELQNGYWSSSHVGNALAWTYYFECEHLRPVLKYVSQGVRAVHLYDASQPNELTVAGGGAFLSKNGILKNCIIQNNQSPSMGGGVYVGIGSSLIDCIVEGNTAPVENEIYYELGNSIDILDQKQVQMFPNPVKAGNNVEFLIYGNSTLSEQMNVRIWDSAGKLISNENIVGTTIVAPSRSGIYFIQIQSSGNQTISKLVVN